MVIGFSGKAAAAGLAANAVAAATPAETAAIAVRFIIDPPFGSRLALHISCAYNDSNSFTRQQNEAIVLPAFPRGDIGFQIRMMDDDRIPTASETELADGRSAPMEPAEAIPLRDYVTYRLTVLAGLVTREGAARFGKEFGLGLPEWRIMRVLSVMPDLTVGQIAERIQMNKGLVSRTVAAMISKGQAIKSACAGDRRSFTVRLSDVGRELHDRILPVSQARQRRVRDCLTDEEREILFRALEKIEALVRTKGSFAPEDAPDDAPDARERR